MRPQLTPQATPVGSPAYTPNVVTVHCSAEALTGLAAEWDQLYDRCPHATAFQTWAWLDSWWREYGSADGLRLFVVRRAGVLVAVAPLMRVRRAGLMVLQPVGSGISDWTDILLDPAVGDSALQALREALVSSGEDWHVVDFPEVPPAAAVRGLFELWAGPRRSVPSSLCSEISAAPMEELVASLSRTNRANVRRALRKIDNAGLTSTFVQSAEVPAATARLVELHLRQWRERGGVVPEHKRPRFTRHLAGAGRDMVDRQQAAVCEYRLDQKLVASSMFIVGRETVGGYLYGVDPELYRQFNVTTLLMRTAMDLAEEHGCSIFSLMRGREDYKSEWRPTSTRNNRLMMCPPRSVAGLVYLRTMQGRELVVETIRTRAPRLGSSARRVHHSLRNPRLLVRSARSAVQERLCRGSGRSGTERDEA